VPDSRVLPREYVQWVPAGCRRGPRVARHQPMVRRNKSEMAINVSLKMSCALS
jgi:hypothetical protein